MRRFFQKLAISGFWMVTFFLLVSCGQSFVDEEYCAGCAPISGVSFDLFMDAARQDLAATQELGDVILSHEKLVTYTLRNIGDRRATIQSITQENSSFELRDENGQASSNICANHLFAGNSCTFQLAFTPTSKQTYSTTLTITYLEKQEQKTLSFNVRGAGIYDPDIYGLRMTAWQTAATHTNVGEALLTVTDNDAFTDPRYGGISRVLVTFDREIDVSTLTASSVRIAGNDSNNSAVNLSGTTITVTTRSNNTIAEINFSPALPNYGKYVIKLQGVLSTYGCGIIGNPQRVISSLKGDSNGDGVVNTNDLSYIVAYYANPISVTNATQVRSDANVDGRVNATDLSTANAQSGRSVRNITVPTIP